MSTKTHIAILGGGPSALFLFKHLMSSGLENLHIDIFEKRHKLGVGMPYSTAGANDEHVTNVSGNEIPMLVTPIKEWIKTVPTATLEHYGINEKFNDYKVLPRLLFGEYLAAQFDLLLAIAREKKVETQIHFESLVTDIVDYGNHITVEIAGTQYFNFDRVVICTGHYWPARYEGKVPGYFDSPYPPSKLSGQFNHPVAIKGSSLTAVDAVKTLARHHGVFIDDKGKKTYQLSPDCPDFKMVLHTRNGMLPAVRFHLENSNLENDALLTQEEISKHIADNDGFLSLDFLFKMDFKEIFRDKEPEFYDHIKHMNVEEFVADTMALREELDPFTLLRAEYAEAEKSIRRRATIYWKEMLGVLSFAMNYPAKYLSAEDMQRLQKALLPLISIVIAYIPQSSTEELLALHEAGLLAIVPVGEDSTVEPQATGGTAYHYDGQTAYFKTFIDCVGQPHLDYAEFPFKGLIKNATISHATLKFRSREEGLKAKSDGKPVEIDASGDYHLQVSGIAINDRFQVLNAYGAYNDRIYIMSVPYIGGYNPDYSGLDFCQEASKAIVQSMLLDEGAAT